MITYPTYPQPILEQASGSRWYLEITNAGTLSAKAKTTDQVMNSRRLTLVSTDRSKAYRLGLNAGDPPSITATEVPAAFGGYEDLFVFSPNGREWTVQVNSSGTLSVKALSHDWPRMGSPILTSPDNTPWRFEVDDGGVYQVTSDPTETRLQQPLILRSQDDTTAWQVTIGNDGILSVSDTALSLGVYYDAELISPTLERWALQVDQNGILYADSITDLINARDSWPLVLAKNGKEMYVVDSRFRYKWYQK